MLHLGAARRVHLRAVAFRYTYAMIDVVTVRSNLNVQNLNTERGQRSDERFENSTLRRQPKLDEGKRSIRAIDERDQRLGNTQHESRAKHEACQRGKHAYPAPLKSGDGDLARGFLQHAAASAPR